MLKKAMADALVKLLGSELEGKDGMVSTEAALAGKKHIMLYFSAFWCPPCRALTAQLVPKYNASCKERELEMIFVSSDKDKASFDEYRGQMPWLAVPFEDRNLKGTLSQQYGIRGIPTLVVLDSEGTLITTDGRSQIAKYFGGRDGKGCALL